MDNVQGLHITETGYVDFSVVKALKKSVGTKRYHEIAENVMLSLSDKISKFSRFVVNNEPDAINRLGQEISAIAGQIGLKGVVDVTNAAVNASARADWTALSALSARLVRITEGSLFLIVQIDEQAP